MDVLIADDDRVLAANLSAHLRKAGLETCVAFDAVQAFMLASRMNVALVILDIGMPGGTGYDVLQRLKTNAKTTLTPVLVLTGTADPKAKERVMQLGAAGYLAKPKDCAEIVAEVLRLMPANPKVTVMPLRAGGMR